jgi:hypothetical protein
LKCLLRLPFLLIVFRFTLFTLFACRIAMFNQSGIRMRNTELQSEWPSP